MPIQPVHQPPYMGKSDQSACKGQADCREAAAYSSKAITHSEAPEQTALWVAKPTHRVGVPKSPNSLPVGTGDMCQGHV
jgi:hypothetical protein